MAVVQPWQRKRASAMRPFSTSGREVQDVAADGIGDFHGGRGVGEFADVSRRLEVVEDGCR